MRRVLVLVSCSVAFACGSSGSPVLDAGVDAPRISSFTASPTALPIGGGEVTLSWVQTGATRLVIDHGGGDVTGKTSVKVTIQGSTGFTLTASNSGGSATSTAMVTVAVAVAPTLTGFTATPASLPFGGGTVHFAWTATDAVSLAITPGVGDVSGASSKDVVVTKTTPFTLTATNPVGVATATTPVTVAAPTSAPKITSFIASPANLPMRGTSTLSWVVTGAEVLTLNNGIGDVTGLTSKDVMVKHDTEFKLVATNVKGFDEAVVLITVVPQPLPTITSFTSNPSTRMGIGPGVVTLSWTTTNADTITIDQGVGDVSTLTSKTVFVSHTTSFVLRAMNDSGTRSGVINVVVN